MEKWNPNFWKMFQAREKVFFVNDLDAPSGISCLKKLNKQLGVLCLINTLIDTLETSRRQGIVELGLSLILFRRSRCNFWIWLTLQMVLMLWRFSGLRTETKEEGDSQMIQRKDIFRKRDVCPSLSGFTFRGPHWVLG